MRVLEFELILPLRALQACAVCASSGSRVRIGPLTSAEFLFVPGTLIETLLIVENTYVMRKSISYHVSIFGFVLLGKDWRA
jgi:hypothetical protein